MAEIGHANVDVWDPASEVNWDLRWPRSIRAYSRMAREDTQVKSILRAVSLPIRRTTWRLDPNGASDEVVRLVAEDLRIPILGDDGRAPLAETGGRVSLRQHLHWVLKMLTYGHAFFEVVYKEVDGRDRLHKLAYRPPGSIQEILVESDGGLAGIKQVPPPGGKGKPVEIGVEHLLAYINDPDDFTWTGNSELRAAYKHWVLRDRQLALEDNVLQRNGMGVPWYEAGTDEPEEIKRGEQIAKKVNAGKSSGGAGPKGAKLSILGVNGQLPSIREPIAYHDSMIARSVLAHFLNLEGKGGSYSLAEIQADTFIQSLQTLAESIADTLNQFLVERMVNLAFDVEHGPYPKITFDPIGSVKDLPMETLSTLVAAGVILPDKDLEEEVRRRGGLPPKRPLEGA
ncbi:phage portal protein family protein [Corynebacterium glutamicum]|uniref:phage portal protein family protein n=1 Tax=Corynebacterium glutamicum TaxID=1718 RepID=UPI001467B871|nr:hypothetical protein [Corynebacterium glutamicum]GFK19283.1 hypothetical protein KbCgl_18550 [Corynebacterium glutamicum]